MTTRHAKTVKPASPMKKRMILFSKFAFVAGLLYFLVQKGFISLSATQSALQRYDLIIPALLGMVLTTFLGVIRWHWLLQAQNIHIKLGRTLQLTLIGGFFNIALPGAISGDFVKAFYVGKEVKGQRARAFGSILFDRIVGLSALVLVSAGAIACRFQTYLHSPLFSAIQVLMGIAAVCVLAFYTYLFLVREHHDPLLRAFKKLEKHFSKTASLTRIYEGIRHYHHHRWTVLKVLLISGLIHLTVGWACLQYARALGDSQVELISLYVVVPLGLLITAIPIAPAGVGTGNVAFLYFFNLVGSARGADVFSLFALGTILMGAVGGLVYFRFRSHNELPELDTISAEGARI